jgi:alkylation response protein AidB-like acyl-CoA dehydrogenase
MYSLQLSPEQLEFRDTVREFTTNEIKPIALNQDRLDVNDRTLLIDLVDQASQMGLRTLALSEDLGGAGADQLTSCIVTEELAAGEADIAAVLGTTSFLGHLLFDRLMNDAQRERFLPKFISDDRFHLAYACHETGTDTRLGVNYHRPASDTKVSTVAAKAPNGEWVINGVKDYVVNAPIAKLFAVLVSIAGQPKVVLVPADAAGITVQAHVRPWAHGCGGDVTFKDCRVPADNLLGDDAAALLGRADLIGEGVPLNQVLSLGIGRAAYDAAVEYAPIRVQGARHIIEHQAIGTKLAECAVRLELARSAVWRAAWAADHPEAVADRSLPDLPLDTIARIFTTEMMVTVAKECADVFGGMGVMRDMPLQKYMHDARVCLHSGDGNSEAKLRLAEAIAGFRRPTEPATAQAAE